MTPRSAGVAQELLVTTNRANDSSPSQSLDKEEGHASLSFPKACLYGEGKRALERGDTVSARRFFEHCRGYGNTNAYLTRLEALDHLVTDGLLRREKTAGLRLVLCKLLECDITDCVVARYAERLHELGYTADALRTLDIGRAKMVGLHLHEGHRDRLLATVEASATPLDRCLETTLRGLERCSNVAALCAKGINYSS